MTDASLLGRVVVVGGAAEVLSSVVTDLLAAGALVAVVSPVRGNEGAHIAYAADPGDPDVWQRVAPHVEQRLGPVDAVVVDADTADLASAVFGPDLARRGHGVVMVAADDDDPAAVVSRLRDRP